MASEQVLQHITGKTQLASTNVDELSSIVRTYPFFSPAQFLLALKQKQENSYNYPYQLQKTTLYFNNPVWLSYLLNEKQVKEPNSTDEIVFPTLPLTEGGISYRTVSAIPDSSQTEAIEAPLPTSLPTEPIAPITQNPPFESEKSEILIPSLEAVKSLLNGNGSFGLNDNGHPVMKAPYSQGNAERPTENAKAPINTTENVPQEQQLTISTYADIEFPAVFGETPVPELPKTAPLDTYGFIDTYNETPTTALEDADEPREDAKVPEDAGSDSGEIAWNDFINSKEQKSAEPAISGQESFSDLLRPDGHSSSASRLLSLFGDETENVPVPAISVPIAIRGTHPASALVLSRNPENIDRISEAVPSIVFPDQTIYVPKQKHFEDINMETKGLSDQFEQAGGTESPSLENYDLDKKLVDETGVPISYASRLLHVAAQKFTVEETFEEAEARLHPTMKLPEPFGKATLPKPRDNGFSEVVFNEDEVLPNIVSRIPKEQPIIPNPFEQQLVQPPWPFNPAIGGGTPKKTISPAILPEYSFKGFAIGNEGIVVHEEDTLSDEEGIDDTDAVDLLGISVKEGTDNAPENHNLSGLISQQAALFKKEVPKDAKLEFEKEPYFTIDYFASQGIKIDLTKVNQDKLTVQLRRFTDWLKVMKKTNPDPSDLGTDPELEKAIQNIAKTSVESREIVTETMADVFVKQGKVDKAIQLYIKLSFMDPSKSAYFAAKIQQLKGI